MSEHLLAYPIVPKGNIKIGWIKDGDFVTVNCDPPAPRDIVEPSIGLLEPEITIEVKGRRIRTLLHLSQTFGEDRIAQATGAYKFYSTTGAILGWIVNLPEELEIDSDGGKHYGSPADGTVHTPGIPEMSETTPEPLSAVIMIDVEDYVEPDKDLFFMSNEQLAKNFGLQEPPTSDYQPELENTEVENTAH